MPRAALALCVLLAACSGRNEPEPWDENRPPVAQAGPDVSAALGEEIFFNGAESSDVDGDVIGWEWNLGDGTLAEGVVVSHAYTNGGVFIVTLTVTDDKGATASDDLLVTVEGSGPVAVALFPAQVRTGEPVLFDATGSSAPTEIAAWRWNFGDGRTATGETVTHSYDRSGSLTVRLTVEDLDGATDMTSAPIEVFPIDIDGVWDLVASPATFSCAEYTAAFEDTVLTITVVDAAGTVEATSNTGRTWTGTLEGKTLRLAASYIAPTGGTCINAPVSANLRVDVDEVNGAFAGNVSAFYDLGIPCQCNAAFPVTGTLR